MQTNGCLSQENGEGDLTEPHLSNGATSNGVLAHPEGGGEPSTPLNTATMTDTDKDIVRLIGQHLQSLGLQ